MTNQDNIKKIFPLISYEEIYNEGWENTYKRFVVSLFNRVLNEKDYEIESEKVINQIGYETIYQKYLNLLLSLNKKSPSIIVNVIAFDKNGNEIIQLEDIYIEAIKNKILDSLKEEKHIKILFPKLGVLFESAFDFSAILYVNDKYCEIDIVKKLVLNQNLNII